MNETRINLGCGNDLREGYVNVDSSATVNPDKVWDLEKTPLPFADDSFDEVVANHVLEHIHNFIPLMHDIHRICKSDASIRIRTPFYASWGQFNDPTHVRFFSPFTFNYFNSWKNFSHEVAARDVMFEAHSIRLNYAVGRARILNRLFNPLINLHHAFYCRFLAWIFPASEIQFHLIVRKSRSAGD